MTHIFLSSASCTSFIRYTNFTKYINYINTNIYNRALLTFITIISSKSKIEIFSSLILLLVKILQLFSLFLKLFIRNLAIFRA